MKTLSEQVRDLEMELEILKSQHEMSEIDKAIAFLKDLDIEAYERNGSVLAVVGENEFFNLEISAAEVSYRAALYDEQVVMKEEK